MNTQINYEKEVKRVYPKAICKEESMGWFIYCYGIPLDYSPMSATNAWNLFYNLLKSKGKL